MGIPQPWNLHMVRTMLAIFSSILSFLRSVHCASIHRKIGTHITKV